MPLGSNVLTDLSTIRSSDKGTPVARRVRKAESPPWAVRLPKYLIEDVV